MAANKPVDRELIWLVLVTVVAFFAAAAFGLATIVFLFRGAWPQAAGFAVLTLLTRRVLLVLPAKTAAQERALHKSLYERPPASNDARLY